MKNTQSIRSLFTLPGFVAASQLKGVFGDRLDAVIGWSPFEDIYTPRRRRFQVRTIKAITTKPAEAAVSTHPTGT